MSAYPWSDRFAIGVNATTVAFAGAGALAAVGPAPMLRAVVAGTTVADWLHATIVIAFAAMSACAVALATCMAGHAQKASRHRQFHGTRNVAIFCLAAFMAVSYAAIYLAWQLLKGASVDLNAIPMPAVLAGALVLAVAKPMTNFVLEGVRAIDRHEETLEDERQARMTRERAENLVRMDEERQRRRGQIGGAMALGAALLGAGTAPPAEAAPFEEVSTATPRPVDESAPAERFGPFNARHRFLMLSDEERQAGPAEIARRLGVHRQTIYKWLAAERAQRDVPLARQRAAL